MQKRKGKKNKHYIEKPGFPGFSCFMIFYSNI